MICYLLEYNRWINVIGISTVLALAFLMSNNKRAVNWSLVIKGLALQFLLGFMALRTSWGNALLQSIAQVIGRLYQFADHGATFLFGNLINPQSPWGFIFAFKVLPIIIFFGALMSLLFYLGIVQHVVRFINYAVQPILGTSGPETLCAVANSFLGQTEAPLLIRHYLPLMTKSEIFVVMVSGMGTISGSILAVFASMGIPAVHLLTASIMAIPATIVIAKIVFPQTEKPYKPSSQDTIALSPASNALEAIASGTSDGLQLALNVGAMLIAFISLIAMLNALLGWGCATINILLHQTNITYGLPILNLNTIFSYVFAPWGYLMGFVGQEAQAIGKLLGTKVAINELIAYGELTAMQLSERTIDVVTYALCGFSNFSCIGIQIGGIGSLMPANRVWLSQLGIRAVLAAGLANILSAMMASLLL